MIVSLNHLTVRAIIGTEPHERRTPQPIELNVQFEYDACRAAASDDLNDAIDYAALTDRLQQRAIEGQFHLLEALGENLLALLREDDRILAGRIDIDKPDALAGSAVVRITARFDRRSGS
jgi:dihydroneopterin aldolase